MFVALGFVSIGRVHAESKKTALDEYIAKADSTYAWKLVSTIPGEKATTYVIHLTSQTWKTTADVNRTVWEHWLVVTKPKEVLFDKAFVMISGGANDGKTPDRSDAKTQAIAAASNSIVAELRMIPNQPLIFHNDGVPRKEDDLIGYCWAQFIKTGDATWLPRLPMVKSVVRAMDCLQEFSKSEAGGGKKIEKFVVAGGSKRGWTTWLTGVADPRVEAIIPIVIDIANVSISMKHHAAAYGFWAESIGNYVEHGIMANWNHPRLAEAYKIIDPYNYIDRLMMPKYVLNAAGDQFFLPDSSQFYYADLKGEKHLRYVANGDHSLRDTDAVTSMVAFYRMILSGQPRPKMDWSFETDGSIVLTTTPKPKVVKLWQANNPTARDFRLEMIGPAYKSTEVKVDAKGRYIGNIATPSGGWSAYFLEATFDIDGDGKYPFKETTAVRITPDRLPFPDIDPSKVPYEGRKPRRQ